MKRTPLPIALLCAVVALGAASARAQYLTAANKALAARQAAFLKSIPSGLTRAKLKKILPAGVKLSTSSYIQVPDINTCSGIYYDLFGSLKGSVGFLDAHRYRLHESQYRQGEREYNYGPMDPLNLVTLPAPEIVDKKPDAGEEYIRRLSMHLGYPRYSGKRDSQWCAKWYLSGGRTVHLFNSKLRMEFANSELFYGE